MFLFTEVAVSSGVNAACERCDPNLVVLFCFMYFEKYMDPKPFFNRWAQLATSIAIDAKGDKPFSQLIVVIWSFLFSVQVPSPAWAKSLESLTRNAFLLCKWELQCKDFFPKCDQISSQNSCQKNREPQRASFLKNINMYFCLQKPCPVKDCLSKHSETVLFLQ